MDRNTVQSKTVLATDLLKLIGQNYLSEIAKKLDSDKWLIKLKTKTVFSLFIYSLLDSNRIGLRGVADNYSNAIFKAIENLGIEDSTAHSSLQDRLCQVDVTYFEKIYERVYQMIEQHYDQPTLSKYNRVGGPNQTL